MEYDVAVNDGEAKGVSVHRIEVTQTAFKTYKSFLTYLLTGTIAFSSLSSSSTTPSSTSPKSFYRLAHFLQIPQLESASLSEYKYQLTKQNIVKELFNVMSRDFEKMGEVTRSKAGEWWDEIKGSKEIKEVIESLEEEGTERWKGAVFAKLAMGLPATTAQKKSADAAKTAYWEDAPPTKSSQTIAFYRSKK